MLDLFGNKNCKIKAATSPPLFLVRNQTPLTEELSVAASLCA